MTTEREVVGPENPNVEMIARACESEIWRESARTWRRVALFATALCAGCVWFILFRVLG